eukprot:scaffold20.g7795.t1
MDQAVPALIKRAGLQAEISAVSASLHVQRECPSAVEDQLCWICLDSNEPLLRPCRCPRTAHPKCLARWQLQSAGTRRETHCEFCDGRLPEWKDTLTPQCGAQAPAVMNVNFDGRTYSFEVKPGPEGYRQFTEAIRRAFNLPDDSELNITFTCDEPSADAGTLLTLQGAGAYDAAVHCASVSAARRLTSPSPSRTTSVLSDMYSAMPGTPPPVSPLGAAPAHSFGTPDTLASSSSTLGGGDAPGGSPSATEAGEGGGGGAGSGGGVNKRKALSGIGRKLRTVLADFLR